MARKTFNCDQCLVEYQPQSARRGKNQFCSFQCKSEFQKTSMLGANNPNYKGVEADNSFCRCGTKKDYRANRCSSCANRSTPVGDPRKLELTDEILDHIKESVTIAEVSTKTGHKRSTISTMIKDYNIDTSHFDRAAYRPGLAEAILVEHNRKNRNNNTVKNLILRENLMDYICAICGQEPLWQNKQLTLELDHISGNWQDDRLENLRFLCPNCHTQTETFRGRKTKGQRKPREERNNV